MSECIVRTLWWTLMLGFVAACGLGAVYLGYLGVTQLLTQRWDVAVQSLAISLTLAGAVRLACRHRTDLLYG